MVSDRNKGIAGITYNHLNLPVLISKSSTQLGNYNKYIYTASGVKVRATLSTPGKNGNPPILNHTDYLGGYQYYNNVLEHFPTAEGYVQHSVSGSVSIYRYIYHYKDHLGNNRVSYGLDPADNTVKILEENHYYPFGFKHFGYNENSTAEGYNYRW